MKIFFLLWHVYKYLYNVNGGIYNMIFVSEQDNKLFDDPIQDFITQILFYIESITSKILFLFLVSSTFFCYINADMIRQAHILADKYI